MKQFIALTPVLLAIASSNCTTVENEAPPPKPVVQSTSTSETIHTSPSPYVAPASSIRTETTTVR